jgi:hypothetical protein
VTENFTENAPPQNHPLASMIAAEDESHSSSTGTVTANIPNHYYFNNSVMRESHSLLSIIYLGSRNLLFGGERNSLSGISQMINFGLLVLNASSFRYDSIPYHGP